MSDLGTPQPPEMLASYRVVAGEQRLSAPPRGSRRTAFVLTVRSAAPAMPVDDGAERLGDRIDGLRPIAATRPSQVTTSGVR
jgi:hypothetical protein